LNLVESQHASQNPIQVKLQIAEHKRVFVIGDLDADLAKFEQALCSVNFNPSTDILFSLGDVIDRGDNSIALLRRFKELGVNMCLGNHEHMLLESLLANNEDYYRLWVENGGHWHTQATDEELKFVFQQLLKCPLSYFVEYAGIKIGLSHTTCANWDWSNPTKDKEKAISLLLWDRALTKAKKPVINPSIDFSVHGHNTTKEPYWLGNSYHLDTNYLSGKPTIVELKTLINQFSSM